MKIALLSAELRPCFPASNSIYSVYAMYIEHTCTWTLLSASILSYKPFLKNQTCQYHSHSLTINPLNPSLKSKIVYFSVSYKIEACTFYVKYDLFNMIFLL